MYTHILFDLDGTLTDSREGVVNCVKYALEKMGRPILPERELNKFLGPPLQQMFQELCGFTPEEAEEGIRLFRERYNTNGKFENAAAPGAVELLRQLKERGYVLALASSKPEAMCHIICDHYGLSPWLDVIAGSPPGLDAEKADVMIPNLTEAYMMAGLPYREESTWENIHSLLEKLPGFSPSPI